MELHQEPSAVAHHGNGSSFPTTQAQAHLSLIGSEQHTGLCKQHITLPDFDI